MDTITDVLHLLNDNSTAIQAIFAGVLGVVTFVYVILTYLLLKETRKQHQKSLQPRLNVYFKDRMTLKVENIGAGTATHGKLCVTGSGGTETYSFIRLFAAPLTPWQYEYPTADEPALPVTDTDERLQVEIECCDLEGRKYGPAYHEPKNGRVGRPPERPLITIL